MYDKLKIFITLCMFTFLLADEIVLPTHEIHFTGQKHFEESDLQDATGVETKKFFQFWKEDRPSIEDKLLPTLEPALKSFYNSEGFYDVKFSIKETNSTIFVTVTENEPVKVRDINISSDYDISSLITLQKNEIFKAKTFISIKTDIIKQLLNDGYCSYEFDTKAYVDLDKHTVDVRYNLEKGGLCTFGKLTITGLKTVDEDIIKSRVRAKEGEVYSPKLVQGTSNNLYALSAFDSIVVNVDRKFYNVIPVDINFTEMEKAYHFEAGVGYDTFEGPRLRSQITKNNFMGNAQKLSLTVSYSDKDQIAKLAFFKPFLLHILDYPIDFGAEIGYSNLEYDGFTEEMSYGKAYLEYKDEKLRLRAGMAFEDIIISLLDGYDSTIFEQAVNEGTFNLLYPYIDAVYDARDDKLNPKYGYYLSAYGELGLAKDDETSEYYKALFEGRIIHTLSNITLSAVGKLGLIDGTDNVIPESKYFFAGGPYSNRAYGYRELGVIISSTEDSINGASTWLNLSLEANFPVKGDIYGAVFTDNTMLTEKSYDFSGEVISSAGLGVRYMTPIGPFKLDVGVNVNDPTIHGINFQIGQSF
ncbi:autotransporter assembly complex family protein [Sulfurovum sp.]|uniref:autotransporter assembly complex protein TamA n=1 Tax=Sulfurovum sp. TaxID=1969726 RepID=UPI0035634F61